MGEERLEHKLQLNGRKQLNLTGVSEVVSFDETVVVLRTSLGSLVIQGEGLQLKNLSQDGGQVAVDGQINALHYEEPRESLWRRFFG